MEKGEMQVTCNDIRLFSSTKSSINSQHIIYSIFFLSLLEDIYSLHNY